MNIKNLNVALVRVLQFAVFVVFTFMVLVYFGVLLLLPLDALAGLIGLLSWVGLPSVVSVLISVPAVGYLLWIIYKTPDLLEMLLAIGVDLVTMGKERVKRFDDVVAAVKG